MMTPDSKMVILPAVSVAASALVGSAIGFVLVLLATRPIVLGVFVGVFGLAAGFFIGLVCSLLAILIIKQTRVFPDWVACAVTPVIVAFVGSGIGLFINNVLPTVGFSVIHIFSFAIIFSITLVATIFCKKFITDTAS